MSQKKIASKEEVSQYHQILSRAALFDGEFNIDWLQELTHEKASKIYAALEYGIARQWLVSGDSIIFFLFFPAGTIITQKKIFSTGNDVVTSSHRDPSAS